MLPCDDEVPDLEIPPKVEREAQRVLERHMLGNGDDEHHRSAPTVPRWLAILWSCGVGCRPGKGAQVPKLRTRDRREVDRCRGPSISSTPLIVSRTWPMTPLHIRRCQPVLSARRPGRCRSSSRRSAKVSLRRRSERPASRSPPRKKPSATMHAAENCRVDVAGLPGQTRLRSRRDGVARDRLSNAPRSREGSSRHHDRARLRQQCAVVLYPVGNERCGRRRGRRLMSYGRAGCLLPLAGREAARCCSDIRFLGGRG